MDKLFIEARGKYVLLNKLPYGIDFFKTYHEYLETALEIEKKSRKERYNNLSSPVVFIHFKIIAIIEGLGDNNPKLTKPKKELIAELKTLPHFKLENLTQNLKFLNTEILFNNFIELVKKGLPEKRRASFEKTNKYSSSFIILKKLYKDDTSINLNLKNLIDKAEILNIYGINKRLRKTTFGLDMPEQMLEISKKVVKEVENPTYRKVDYITRIKPIQEHFNLFTPKLDYDYSHKKSDLVKFYTLEGKISVNINSGDVKINKDFYNINPNSKEFKFLKTMLSKKDFLAEYGDLWLNSKTSRMNFTQTVKRLKIKLEILPQKKSRHLDFIENIKGLGYKIVTSSSEN